MKLRSISAIVATLALFASPAFAVDAAAPPPNPDCTTLKTVIGQLESSKETFVLLDSKSLIGVAAEGVGAIIVTTMGDDVVIGFERDGCMHGPALLGKKATGA